MLRNRPHYSLLATLLVFTGTALSGSVFDYVKPIDCPPHHKMKNIDCIYMINLDERPEKYQQSIKELEPFGIRPYRFSAVNGWKDFDLKVLRHLGVRFKPGMAGGQLATRYTADKNGNPKPIYEKLQRHGEIYFSGRTTGGVLGCTMSHLSILKHAYDKGFNTIWVMEDDIKVLKNPHLISELIAELNALVGNGNWDILFTDYDFRDANGRRIPSRGYKTRPNYAHPNLANTLLDEKVSSTFRRVGGRFGTHSMVISRSGIVKLVHFFKKYNVYHPIDLELNAPGDMKLYTVLKDVVSSQLTRISDINQPRYKKRK